VKLGRRAVIIQKGCWKNSPKKVYNAKDAGAIYDILEKEVVPLFYNRNGQSFSNSWIELMKGAIKSTEATFSSRRMVKEYVNSFYKNALPYA
jgi:glycogen phosphorylase